MDYDVSITPGGGKAFLDETITVNASEVGGSGATGTSFTVAWDNGAGSSGSASGTIGTAPATFMLGANGNYVLTFTNGASFADPPNGAIRGFLHATGYGASITGPHKVGQADTFFVQSPAINSGFDDQAFDGSTTITFTDNLADGPVTVTPARYSVTGSSTRSYTQIGTHTYTLTNDGGFGGDPSPMDVVVTAPSGVVLIEDE